MKDRLILVDKEDNEIGYIDKLEAHEKALLHRAVSVFIFNSKGEWLLQQRAEHKYHSGNLWSNTACTHPFPGEKTAVAASRRLQEEMGMNCEIKKAFHYIYKAKLDDNLVEYEFDHIFIGFSDELPKINKDEVMNYKFISSNSLIDDIKNDPEKYTAWFKKLVEKVNLHINS